LASDLLLAAPPLVGQLPPTVTFGISPACSLKFVDIFGYHQSTLTMEGSVEGKHMYSNQAAQLHRCLHQISNSFNFAAFQAIRVDADGEFENDTEGDQRKLLVFKPTVIKELENMVRSELYMHVVHQLYRSHLSSSTPYSTFFRGKVMTGRIFF
jgi:hypothetical protein